MWNEKRSDYLKKDIYRATKSITIFEKLGFVKSGKGSVVYLLSFHDTDVDIEDFMIQSEDVAILAVGIMDILKKINLSVPYFDYLYENLS